MTGTESIAARLEQIEADISAVQAENRELEARTRAQEARIAAQEAEIRDLRARPEPSAVRSVGATPAAGTPAGGAVDRRSALKKGLGLAGAAAAGAVLLDASPAAAGNGNSIVIGSENNTGSLGTGLTVTSPAAAFGFGVVDIGLAGQLPVKSAVFGHAQFQAFRAGVLGLADGTNTFAVWAQASGSNTGLRASSVTGTAAWLESDDGPGLVVSSGTSDSEESAVSVFSSGRGVYVHGTTHIHTEPNENADPPASALPGFVGDLRWTRTSEVAPSALWACIGDGAPGTWRKIVGSQTAGAFHLLPTPVRVYDSRPGTAPPQGPKTLLPAGNVARTIDLKLNNSGVPAGATGALVTVLLVNATSGQGNFTMWANDKPKPLSNTMVWGGSAGRFTSVATTALSPNALVKVDASLPTNVVLDVVGYYR